MIMKMKEEARAHGGCRASKKKDAGIQMTRRKRINVNNESKY
jgi:hypothetical protein